jgi:L-amino acid N-acyltransferase YncA
MSSAGLRVRTADAVDLDLVAGIYRHYVNDSVATFEETPPGRADWVERHRRTVERGLPFLVAEAGELIVGYAYATAWRARPAYRHTVEESVYVAPWATGNGVGRALLEELVRHCAVCGVREIVAVIVDTGDTASVALHRRCGFEEVGRLARVGHKHGRWLDTLLLQRSLAAEPDSLAG